jgi:hypothetical protein
LGFPADLQVMAAAINSIAAPAHPDNAAVAAELASAAQAMFV